MTTAHLDWPPPGGPMGGHVRNNSEMFLRPRTPNLITPKPSFEEKEAYVTELLLDNDSDEEKLHHSDNLRRSNKPLSCSRTMIAAAWMMSIFLSIALTFIFTQTTTMDKKPSSFDRGYSTELQDALPVIQVQPRRFTGSLDFANRHGFIPQDSPSLAYVGATPEVDAAWEGLTHDRYFLLSDSEAQVAFGHIANGNLSKFWNEHHGGYAAGLDVLHTLHCLNHLRKSLYPKTYPQDPEHGIMHLAHCVDHLRQLAMCNADLTPIPTQYFPGISKNYINSSMEHTCRDFSQVRQWSTERFNGSSAVKGRNRDGSPRADFYAPWG